MTVEGVPKLTSDEGLVNYANCALKMLRESPRIQKANEVSADFLTEIAMILFGTDLVPYMPPCSNLHRSKNITAVIDKLSQEIELQLDHICPSDVVSGDRKAVSNLLELLTAFILHCVDEDLLDFSAGCREQSVIERSVSESTTSQFCYAHVSTPPELPRASLSRPCPYTTTPHSSEKPFESREQFQALIYPDAFADANSANQNHAYLKHDPRVSCTNDEFLQEQRSSSVSVTRLTPMHRLHSYFALPSDVSPPATPKTANDMVEIIEHHSPPTVPPSLHCSPVLDPNDYPTLNARVTWDNVKPSLNQDGMTEVPADTLSDHQTSSHFPSPVVQRPPSPPSIGSEFEDESDCLKHTAISQRSSRRKVSSSSSGRGHSPTQTLTAPGASVTSMPPSLSELPFVNPSDTASIKSKDPRAILRDTACQTSGKLFIRTPRNHHKHSTYGQRYCCTHTDAHGSHTSMATTSSILDWPGERPSHLESEGPSKPGDSATSVLSSNLDHKLSDKGLLGLSSSASVLLARTEGFSRALKRRLDYLRMIFCRAHDEAEAVSQLVQLIGTQSGETLEFMNRCLSTDKSPSSLHGPLKLNTAYSYKPLEQMIQRILVGIEILLRRQVSPRVARCTSRDSSNVRVRFPLHRTTKLNRRKMPSASRPVLNNNCSDLQFDELMNMKHSLMVDALNWLQSELKTKAHCSSSAAH